MKVTATTTTHNEEKEKILNENNRVLHFIKKWQASNKYNPDNIEAHNKKFKDDFNEFLESGNFSKETILIFKS